MLITLENDADPGAVARELAARGLWTRRVDGASARHLLVEAHSAAVEPSDLLNVSGIREIAHAPSPHPLVDAQPKAVAVGRVTLGLGQAPVLMAGPCSVDSPEAIAQLAAFIASAGATVLRGGALKPRTSPYAFQGHGHEALRWMRAAADRHGLAVVTEALGEADAEPVAEHSDLVQVGSRNMQNFALLKAVGRTRRPVLLKRGMSATIEEWLLAAEHLRHAGAPAVVFCERGLRSFDARTRNLLDLGAVALLTHVHRQPVVVDPSHAAGRRDLVVPLSHAALAAGACGLLVEAHHDPSRSLSDGPQALPLDALRALARTLGGSTHEHA